MQLEPETVAAIDRQVTAFTNRYGGKFPRLAEDIQQEAWSWALASVPKYQPDHPGAKGFFYMVAHRHVLKQIDKWMAVTSLSNEAARQGEGLNQTRFMLGPSGDPHNHAESGRGAWRALQAPEVDPEGGERLQEANARLASLRVRWRRAVDRATVDLSPEEREVGALVQGLDGPLRGPAWVARRMGIWRDEVERAAKAYEKAIRKPAIRRLKREIDLLEEILP